MSQLLEDTNPSVAIPGSLNTNKPVVFGSTLAVTGVATFTATPVFNGGRTATVTNLTAATSAPTAANSGTVYTFDKADGITVTLPAPVVGLEYIYVVKTTITSNSYKVITDAGTTFLTGTIVASIDNAAGKEWVGNGTTHLAVTQASASTNATGGIIGSYLKFTCVTATLWHVFGFANSGGTATTPFATS